jgi:hypothetical protein
MRELTLQRRLGHPSPEATRVVYTRVSNLIVVAEYRRALGLDGPTTIRRRRYRSSAFPVSRQALLVPLRVRWREALMPAKPQGQTDRNPSLSSCHWELLKRYAIDPS